MRNWMNQSIGQKYALNRLARLNMQCEKGKRGREIKREIRNEE